MLKCSFMTRLTIPAFYRSKEGNNSLPNHQSYLPEGAVNNNHVECCV